MIELAVLLGAAGLGYALSRWLDLPPVPFLLLTGLALGATGLLEGEDLILDILMLGVTFLLFVAGTELSPRRVGRYQSAARKIGLAQFTTLALVGLGVTLALGYALSHSIYIALALAASSTLVVVRLMQQRRQMFEPFGRVVIGVLFIQDLLIVLLIPALTHLSDGLGAVAMGVAGTLVLLALTAVMIRWGAPFLVLRLELDAESLLLVILSVLFGFMGLAYTMNVPIVSAAFLAGVSLSGFPISGLVHSDLRPISDFFTAIFFTSLGAVIVVPAVAGLWHAAVFALLVVVITPLLVTFLAERAGLSARPAIESGLLLSQTSEFSLVVGLQGLATLQIGPDIFTIIALTTVLTMILTPVITSDRVVWYLMQFHPLRSQGKPRRAPEDHILVIGAGESTMPLIETLLFSNHEVVVIDDDPAVVDRLREADILCIRGDGSDHEVLEAAGVDRARIILASIRRPLDIAPALSYARDIPVLVRVFEEADAERIRELGGEPVMISEAAAEEFMRWFETTEALRAQREGTIT